MSGGWMLAFVLAALLGVPQWLERLYRKPDPNVAAAMEEVRKGDAPKAVELLDKAGDALKEPQQQGELAFDKSAALLMIGKQGASLAADEARRALESPARELHARSAYNLGFALADQGKRDEAVDAYGKSLTLDAADRDAKWNLELLLREEEQQQNAGGQKNDDKKDSKEQQKQEQQQNAQGNPDQEQKKSEEKKQEDQKNQQKQSEQQQQQQKQEQQKQQGKDEQQQAQGQEKKDKPQDDKQQQAQGRPVDRTQAQRLLDALRANEKNLQVWRFGQKKLQPSKPRNVEKDW